MPSLDDVRDHPELSGKTGYKEFLEKLQYRLLALQRRMHREKRRAIVALEGWDAAGKGGAIRRLTETLDPRGYQVWPIAAPRPDEQGRHYLYRFWTRLPEPGVLGIFDRSWYGRVLVERIEKFATKDEWRRAYDEINRFERMLVDDGCPVVKIFLHITKQEQLRRFRERELSPWKNWKIGPDDWRNRRKWDKYVTAIDDMFDRCHTSRAPWTPVAANHKWYARTKVMETVATSLEKAWG